MTTMSITGPVRQPQVQVFGMPLSIETRNETAFLIKQIATAIHFFSLLGLAFTYILEDKENMFYIGIATGISGIAAFFIPPTGLIQPDDAPGTEYAKTAMSWQVSPDQVANRIMEERAAETKKAAEEDAAKKVTKSKKKA